MNRRRSTALVAEAVNQWHPIESHHLRMSRLVPKGKPCNHLDNFRLDTTSSTSSHGIMPERRKLMQRREIPNTARYLTFSCQNRATLLGTPEMRSEFADQLFLTRARLDFKLLGWVIMPEHVHLLIYPGDATVTQILIALKRSFATRILARWRNQNDPRINITRTANCTGRFWQAGGGYDRNIFGGHELPEKLNYIHENPKRRGLVPRAIDWEWSSARACHALPTQWPEIDRI